MRPELGIQLPSLADIPDPIEMTGWKEVPIQESGQQLVDLESYIKDFPIVLAPQYHLQGIPNSSDKMSLRLEAAERLAQASKLLPRNYSLIVFDSHRPIQVQQSLFDSFRNQVRLQYPKDDEEEIVRKTQRFVSLPSAIPTRPSPHSTGGAIDLSIVHPNSSLLEMGTWFDDFTDASQTAYFKNRDGIYHTNRLLLYRIMTSVGFSNYPEEWWHYDYGNQFWGHITTNAAIYGFIEGGELNDTKQ